jgi:hypothetical protein
MAKIFALDGKVNFLSSESFLRPRALQVNSFQIFTSLQCPYSNSKSVLQPSVLCRRTTTESGAGLAVQVFAGVSMFFAAGWLQKCERPVSLS